MLKFKQSSIWLPFDETRVERGRVCIVLRPAWKYCIHIETSPLPVKDCQIEAIRLAHMAFEWRDVYPVTPIVTENNTFIPLNRQIQHRQH